MQEKDFPTSEQLAELDELAQWALEAVTEARFKVKYNGQLGPWESIPFVAIMTAGMTPASRIAAGMAKVPGVKEVRLSFAGSQQGYYYRGSK